MPQMHTQLTDTLFHQHETLRLYDPVSSVPREITSTRPLKIAKNEYIIYKNIHVVVNASAIHTSPELWGPDPYAWRPRRWIITPNASSSSSTASASPLANETLLKPKLGSFIPWIMGPRVCPGMKFSQVEFTAVLATLLRGHMVRPVLLKEEGETEEEAKKRAVAVAEDSSTKVTLKINNPQDLKMRWEEVGR